MAALLVTLECVTIHGIQWPHGFQVFLPLFLLFRFFLNLAWSWVFLFSFEFLAGFIFEEKIFTG